MTTTVDGPVQCPTCREIDYPIAPEQPSRGAGQLACPRCGHLYPPWMSDPAAHPTSTPTPSPDLGRDSQQAPPGDTMTAAAPYRPQAPATVPKADPPPLVTCQGDTEEHWSVQLERTQLGFQSRLEVAREEAEAHYRAAAAWTEQAEALQAALSGVEKARAMSTENAAQTSSTEMRG